MASRERTRHGEIELAIAPDQQNGGGNIAEMEQEPGPKPVPQQPTFNKEQYHAQEAARKAAQQQALQEAINAARPLVAEALDAKYNALIFQAQHYCAKGEPEKASALFYDFQDIVNAIHRHHFPDSTASLPSTTKARELFNAAICAPKQYLDIFKTNKTFFNGISQLHTNIFKQEAKKIAIAPTTHEVEMHFSKLIALKTEKTLLGRIIDNEAVEKPFKYYRQFNASPVCGFLYTDTQQQTQNNRASAYADWEAEYNATYDQYVAAVLALKIGDTSVLVAELQETKERLATDKAELTASIDKVKLAETEVKSAQAAYTEAFNALKPNDVLLKDALQQAEDKYKEARVKLRNAQVKQSIAYEATCEAQAEHNLCKEQAIRYYEAHPATLPPKDVTLELTQAQLFRLTHRKNPHLKTSGVLQQLQDLEQKALCAEGHKSTAGLSDLNQLKALVVDFFTGHNRKGADTDRKRADKLVDFAKEIMDAKSHVELKALGARLSKEFPNRNCHSAFLNFMTAQAKSSIVQEQSSGRFNQFDYVEGCNSSTSFMTALDMLNARAAELKPPQEVRTCQGVQASPLPVAGLPCSQQHQATVTSTDQQQLLPIAGL